MGSAVFRHILFGAAGGVSPGPLRVVVGAQYGQPVYAISARSTNVILSDTQLSSELALRRLPWRLLAWIIVLGLLVADGVALALNTQIGFGNALLVGVLLGIACVSAVAVWLAPRYSVSFRYTKEAQALDAGAAHMAALERLAQADPLRLLTPDGSRFAHALNRRVDIARMRMPISPPEAAGVRFRAGWRTLYFMPDAVYERRAGRWSLIPYSRLAVIGDIHTSPQRTFGRIALGFPFGSPVAMHIANAAAAQGFATGWRAIRQHAFLRRTFTAVSLAYAAESDVPDAFESSGIALPAERVTEVSA